MTRPRPPRGPAADRAVESPSARSLAAHEARVAVEAAAAVVVLVAQAALLLLLVLLSPAAAAAAAAAAASFLRRLLPLAIAVLPPPAAAASAGGDGGGGGGWGGGDGGDLDEDDDDADDDDDDEGSDSSDMHEFEESFSRCRAPAFLRGQPARQNHVSCCAVCGAPFDSASESKRKGPQHEQECALFGNE